jgi:ATP-dependent Clp protease ATP-binding subunit ClpA
MEKEVFKILQFLSRKNRKNVLIVGDHGVGKTKLVHGVAIAGMKGVVEGKSPKCRILELNLPALLSAPKDSQGAMVSLINLLKANPEMVLFVDGIRLLLDAGESADNARSLLGTAIKTSEIACIGTLTAEEHEELSAGNALAGAHLEIVRLEPLSEEKTSAILEKFRPSLERHHGVQISDEALEDAVTMTQQYMPKRHLPGKAIEVLDQACARYKLKVASLENYPDMVDSASMRRLGTKVGSHDVKRVIMEITAVDIDADQAQEWKKQLGQRLKRHIVGQDAAVEQVAATMTQVRMTFGRSGRPAGVMLLAGPSGTGKMHTIRCLTYQLLGSDEDLTVFDMSNYTEPEAVARLFGVTSEQEGDVTKGELARARNAPFAIVAFDGIERAPKSFFEILDRVLSSGSFKDSHGHEISLRNCLIVLSLNGQPSSESSALREHLLKEIPREVLDRCDAIVSFRPLESSDVRLIVRRGLEELYRTLKPRGISLRVDNTAYDLIMTQGYSPQKGATNLPEILERLVAKPASDLIEAGKIQSGATLEVAEQDGRVVVRVAN